VNLFLCGYQLSEAFCEFALKRLKAFTFYNH
jgi:hypothetical protein